MSPSIVSVNVGLVREIEMRGRIITTAIWKSPVSGRVPLRGVNFAGDDQADRTVHGGRDKAVYAYSEEDYAYWRDEEGVATEAGLFGENLTTRGIDLSLALVGERWAVGSAILEVTKPRLPCYKLAVRLNDPHFVRRFAAALRMGAYFRVIQEGDVAAGDPIVVTRVPSLKSTLRSVAEDILG